MILSASVKAQSQACTAISQPAPLANTVRLDEALFTSLEGKTIAQVDISVEHIFDLNNPEENNWLFRLANRLQVRTRKEVIRDQLLFKAGDTINVDTLKESMRILFNREYLLDIRMTATAICEDGINLHVIARNAWVIEPKISGSRKGGENTSSVGLSDGNFLGSGNTVSVAYESNADRNMMIYRYKSENFLRQRWLADFYYAELSQGNDRRIFMAKPFFSNTTRWSYGFDSSKLSLLYKTRFNDEIINEFDQSTQNNSVFLGHAYKITDNYSNRINIGITEEKDRFTPTEESIRTPEDEDQKYIWLALERATTEFAQYDNLNLIARAEDIPLGSNYQVLLGLGEFGNGDRLYRSQFRYGKAFDFTQEYLLQFRLNGDITYNADSGSLQNSLIGLQGTYNHFITEKHRWLLRLNYQYGKNLSEHRQLTVGETTGVRGYPLEYQRGDNRYVANIERRYYSNMHWFNLVRVGAVAFLDIGRAWGAERYPDTDHLVGAGVGLRFFSSKTGNPTVLHVNISTPLTGDDNLDPYLLSISAEGTF